MEVIEANNDQSELNNSFISSSSFYESCYEIQKSDGKSLSSMSFNENSFVTPIKSRRNDSESFKMSFNSKKNEIKESTISTIEKLKKEQPSVVLEEKIDPVNIELQEKLEEYSEINLDNCEKESDKREVKPVQKAERKCCRLF